MSRANLPRIVTIRVVLCALWRIFMKPDTKQYRTTVSPPPPDSSRHGYLLGDGLRASRFQFVITLGLMLVVAVVSTFDPGTSPLLKHDSIYAQSAFVPVCQRNPSIRDAIVVAVMGDGDCSLVTQAQVNALTTFGYSTFDRNDLTADYLVLKPSDFSGFVNLETLRITYTNLRKLTRGLFSEMPKLTALTLSHNAINEIEPGSFEGLQLTSLFLDDNRLEELDERAFEGVGATLNSIFLTKNQLTTLKAGTFRGLSGLTSLDLSQNELTSLEDGIFGDADKLVYLLLHTNLLKSFPAGTLPNTLKRLYLQNNSSEMDTLPELASGTELSLLYSPAAVEEIPPSVIDAIENVQFLVLPRKLSAWPAGYELPEGLVYLYAAGNATFTALPDDVLTGTLPSSLKYLYVFDLVLSDAHFAAVGAHSFAGGISGLALRGNGLDEGRLDELITRWCGGDPANCTTWTGPSWLYLYDDLSEWDTSDQSSTVPALSNVQTLVLRNNMMSATQVIDLLSNMCDANSGGCDKLERLTLSQENLDGFVMEDGSPLNKFSRLHSIAIVDSGIGSETAKRILNSLEITVGGYAIDLNGNNIVTLPRRLVETCNHRISSIRLKGNRILEIPPSFFANTPNLQIIDLGDNRLTEFPAKIFDDVDDCAPLIGSHESPELRVLYLNDNQLSNLPVDSNGKYFGKHRRLEIVDLRGNFQLDVELGDFAHLTKQIRILLSYALPEAPVPEAPVHVSSARILRIEPSIREVTVSPGDVVRMSFDIYGRQEILDNELGKGHDFEWNDDGAGGRFEATNRANTIIYTAPESPGMHTVTVNSPDGACLGGEDAEERCSAKFTFTVRRSTAVPVERPAPKNPVGEIPSVLVDSAGRQYEVFTPEQGGTFDGGDHSVTAPAGAVPSGEVVGVRMDEADAASNVGMTAHRYTLVGNSYDVLTVDGTGAAISSYVLNAPMEVCFPLPTEARRNISDVAIVANNPDDTLTILSASGPHRSVRAQRLRQPRHAPRDHCGWRGRSAGSPSDPHVGIGRGNPARHLAAAHPRTAR